MRAVEQLFRCFPVPDKKIRLDKETKEPYIPPPPEDFDYVMYGQHGAEVNRVGAPWAGPMLIFDCETLTGAKDGQGLRFGCFQERGLRFDWKIAAAAAGTLTRDQLDRCWHDGIFYNPKNCTKSEIACMRKYAAEHGIELLAQDDFVKYIVFRNHWIKQAEDYRNSLREPCLIIGHNLPFDLGAIAARCGLAKKQLYGGLSLNFRGKSDKFERAIAIKKLGFGKHMFQSWRETNGARMLDGQEAPKLRMMSMTEYCDTQTLARALLGPGASSMKELLRRLNVPKEFQKETADYDGPITPEYIEYCRSDVENTWQLFKALRELYIKHGRTRPMHRIYSEASLGKAYLDDLGVVGFQKQNPDFNPEIIGAFMESYYGGRSEVRIRHENVEVMLCDFKSQYPTLNALMGLQRFVLGKNVGVHTNRPQAKTFLKTVTLDDLQIKQTWLKLCGVALIEPDNDILPFRAQYGEGKDADVLSVNIGMNKIISACPASYTFADIIASKLLTGKTPKILKTLELYPIGKQQTNVIKLFDDDKYTIDLEDDDFFTKVIEARIERKFPQPFTTAALHQGLRHANVKLAWMTNRRQIIARACSNGWMNAKRPERRLRKRAVRNPNARRARMKFPIIKLKRLASSLRRSVRSFQPLGDCCSRWRNGSRRIRDYPMHFAIPTAWHLRIIISAIREKNFAARFSKSQLGFKV
jgi:hypothetical protein